MYRIHCNMFFIFFITYFTVITGTNSLQSTIVNINSGPIEGRYDSNELIGKPFFAFQGIPYAEPPVGSLRFQPPQQPKPWNSTLQTKVDGSQCMQKHVGSEDCLYLNVYTPVLPNNNNDSKKLLPVMVYIHGGAFIRGSSSIKSYGPQYLMNKNVVLVSFNYRLNVFGFLNAHDELAQGNVGLKDQVAALKWVQQNIKEFGGDPKEVTLFGHSAGGASVHYLVLSQLAKGFFKRAIIQSGSALNAFALQKDPEGLVYKLGDLMKCKSTNISDVVKCLQDTPAAELLNASFNSKLRDVPENILNNEAFIPSIENNVPGAFLTETCYSLLTNNKAANKVPLIIGYVNNEALFFLNDIREKQVDLEIYEKHPDLLVPAESLNIINDTTSKNEAAKDILEHYFNDKSAEIKDINNFIKYQSQNFFVRGIRKSIELMRKHFNMYFYIFTYKNENEPLDYPGVPHGGELKYIFHVEGANETTDDKKIREEITTLWTNFAKTGNPTPHEDATLDNKIWPTVLKSESDSINYLDINNHLTISKNPQEHCFVFWENIFKKYGKKPLYMW